MRLLKPILLCIITLAVYIFAFIPFPNKTKTLEQYVNSSSKALTQQEISAGITETYVNDISAYFNDNYILRTVDAYVIERSDTGAKDTLIPANYINEMLDCNVYMLNGELGIIRGDKSVKYAIPQESSVGDGISNTNEGFYVSLSRTCMELGLGYKIEENTIKVSGDNFALPAKYDLRQLNKTPAVRNQYDLGTCWAFSGTSCVESMLAPRKDVTFSVDHMVYNNGYALDISQGGLQQMCSSYFLSWRGPVYENADPYADGKTNTNAVTTNHVQEVQQLPSKDYEAIKRAVYKYGAVQTNIYCSLVTGNDNKPEYNRNYATYCYSGSDQSINHEIIIVGWDDNFPANRFNYGASSNGAFICQNSWGSEFGEGGCFYVSYDDKWIGTNSMLYSQIDDPDNFDEIYQTDLCGHTSEVGTGTGSDYAMNIYTASKDSNISAIGFYNVGTNARYKLYVVPNAKDAVNVRNTEPVAEGAVNKTGYFTVPFKIVPIKAHERFAVVLQIESDVPNNIAVEENRSLFCENVDTSDGEGYISADGVNWERTESVFNSNVCLKAYTKKVF